MNLIQRNGEEKISHFDLSTILRIEPKTLKYHIQSRLTHLQELGTLDEDTSGRQTFYLNKKQIIFVLTFVSNNPDAKISIINYLLKVDTTFEDMLRDKCGQFIKDINPLLEYPKTVEECFITHPTLSTENINDSKAALVGDSNIELGTFMEKVANTI